MKTGTDKKIGIFIIPSLLTTVNLFFGFYSIIAVLKSDYTTAAVAILIAMLFDVFDGKIARLTNSTSRFGVEYDSLSDLASFGIAPGLLIYTWGLNAYGKIGWLAVFLYIACGAMRLARFNTLTSGAGGGGLRHFTGLPIPAAAGLIATTVIFDHHILQMGKEVRPVVILLMTYVLAYLMVSSIPYRSFKEAHMAEKRPLSSLIAAVLVLIVIVAEPQIMLFVLFALYAASGILGRFVSPVLQIVRRKASMRKGNITQNKDI
ncbi:MAG TPA: CDP-diacylglycerol--serine O-phosphatidyltransferase [Nitrospirota bacterium]|nr:CDP-diacylglycerol--serine O-phosphatidyltransferase [Nitrospirota bacterium]